MDQLIQITTVPIQYELKINNARLEYSRSKAELEIHKNDGGLSIKSRPVKLKLDSFQARNSVVPTTATSVKQSAQKGQQAAYSATAQLAQEGQLLLKADIGQDVIGQIAAESTMKNYHPNSGIKYLPSVPPEITWDPGEMHIRYEMDKLNFDWKFNQGGFEFTPGDIEFTVTQRPDVVIKYLGGPIYVPPSSDPNYEPVDVKA